MREEKIRAIAICLCLNGERILVAEGYDSKKGETFYRPLGGTIEFGERGEETVAREFIEEIGAVLVDTCFLGMLENIFTYEGQRGHEIVLVYDGRLANASLYKQEVIQGDEMGTPFKAVWKSLGDFRQGNPPVYPDRLKELLEKQQSEDLN